jgi:hypothetical protein
VTPRRWAVFEDEDHTFCVVTEKTGDMVTWPEMTEADCDNVVAEHNAAVEARADALDVARLIRAVEAVQAELTQPRRYDYDADSWDIFVGNQMQRILDVLTPTEETPAEALNHAIHDATGYKP